MSLKFRKDTILTDDYLYEQWLRNRPPGYVRAHLRHAREAKVAGPAIGRKEIGTPKEHIDLLVKLLHVIGHVLWLSIDDSSKRFVLLELT